MSEDERSVSNVIQIDESAVRDHLSEMVRGSVEETLNTMLDADADRLTNAKYYERKLQTKAGEVSLRVPKLRQLKFEAAIIERYRRRESSVEEALVEMYLAGVSTRRVEDITEALWGTRVSLSTVSELNKWQRCTVHFYRNVFTRVPSGKVDQVAAMLKAIHAQEDRREAAKKAKAVGDKLRGMKLAKAADVLEAGVADTLTYYGFPAEHWRRIRTNNPVERIIREVRRRTQVVGSFPDGHPALMLVSARLRHVAGSKWGTRRYLDMSRLREVDAIAVA